jgi:peptidylprolyl isomerase
MLATLPLAAMAQVPVWRLLDTARTLVIEATTGRIVIEMQPGMAPLAVERVSRLAREGVYDGLQIHRVIPGFVAQTGNPNNKDGGTSSYPDLPPEFLFMLSKAVTMAPVVERSDAVEGFVGATPVTALSTAEQARTPDRRRAWGNHCTGVVGMGRQADPGSANSEIYIMLAPARRLDRDYTVIGRVVAGMEAVQALPPGEPPAAPALMNRVRVAADLPEAERPALEVLNEDGPAFRALVARVQAEKGAAFTVCDVPVTARPARR